MSRRAVAAVAAAARLLSLALLAASAAACGGAEAAAGPGTTHEVRTGSLRIVVKETGTLRAKNSTAIKARIPGTAKIVWLIPQGTEVKEGDKLAELEKTEVQKTVDSLRSQIVSLELDRKTAKTDLDIQEAEGAASVQKAELAVEIKRKEMERYKQSDAPQELRKKLLAVEKAESEAQRKKERWTQVQQLLKEGFVTQYQAEEDRIALKTADNDLQSAREDLEGYRKFTEEIQLRQKESEAAEAERNLVNERLKADNLLERKKVAHDQAEQSFKNAVESLKEAEEQLEAMTVKAPGPGIVIYQSERWSEEELKVGSSVYNDQPFLQLPDLSEMQVVVGVHEADINKLKPGLAVSVTVDSAKGRTLQGKIVRVATVAAERDWRSDIRKFEVVVDLEKTDLPLKPGLTAKVEILVGAREGVLTLPLQAVFVKEGQYYAFVEKGARPERREVALGESSETTVEVVKGIAEGDRVLLFNPEASDAAAPASPAAREANGARPAAKGGGAGGKGGKP
jgi:HlyD family secretion protein